MSSFYALLIEPAVGGAAPMYIVQWDPPDGDPMVTTKMTPLPTWLLGNDSEDAFNPQKVLPPEGYPDHKEGLLPAGQPLAAAAEEYLAGEGAYSTLP
jgi:hypothetical protein